MEDREIIELYFKRSENAVLETKKHFGKYCYHIAFNILGSFEDAEECVNDTYLRVWNSIPPQKPRFFSVFIGKITRNIALDRYRSRIAQKRSSGQMPLILDELSECISDSSDSNTTDDIALKDSLNDFLNSLKEENLQIFMRRYWYMYSISDIAMQLKISESKVKTVLFRTRKELKEYLLKEGIEV